MLSSITSKIASDATVSIIKLSDVLGGPNAGMSAAPGLMDRLRSAIDFVPAAEKMDTKDLMLAHKANAAKQEALEKLRGADWGAAQLGNARDWIAKHQTASIAGAAGLGALGAGTLYLAGKGLTRKDDED